MTNNLTGFGTQRVKVFNRDLILKMLQAALESGDYRFARQTAISWLAAFPGDLEITVLQAKAVVSEGRPAQVIPALDLVCRKDPLFLEAHRILAWAVREIDEKSCLRAKTIAYVLGDRIPGGTVLEVWGKPLKEAWTLIQAQEYDLAHGLIDETLRLAPDLLLAHLFRLFIVRAEKDPQQLFTMAQEFNLSFPDCLYAGLVLADSYLQQGNELEAVRLLHLGAAGDTMGQVARCLWGEGHSYRALWPDDMVIHFDQPIPAGVASRLGWNHLSPGEILKPETLIPEKSDDHALNEKSLEKSIDLNTQLDNLLAVLDRIVNSEDEEQVEKEAELAPIDETVLSSLKDNPCQDLTKEDLSIAEDQIKDPEPIVDEVAIGEAAAVSKHVEGELEKLARKLRQPAIARSDGRFPVYVILTTHKGLEDQYGPQTASVIDGELRRLAAAVGKRQGWQSMVFYPDDAACVNQYGLDPVNPQDPWKLKHGLVDLDAALAKRGEMIGALLIIGGDLIVPFHRLPNPTDDSDGEVASDSPYATLDANYFVPEWPIGRLPGESGPDAGTLLEQIRQVQRFHNHRAKGRLSFGKEWIIWIRARLRTLAPSRTSPSFGYTAAVWRRSSLAVFRPIGAPHTVLTSPPAFSGGLKRKASANLGYYNLHGLEDSPAWYGQRDPMEAGATPDYPVALSPDDLHRNGRSPKFIFSEACYGGHVFGKTEKDSLALKFISLGTQGVVASTCISYGSISTPLIAADLLGHLFWQQLKSGKTAGEALMTAKVNLVREMIRRQGYLDGEDQKTLISFVLYGDPLASYDGFRVHSKGMIRSKDHPMVRTTSGESQEVLAPTMVPAEVLKEVKQVVSEYLPGADVAGIQFCRLQMGACAKEIHPGGFPFLGKKNGKDQTGRLMVTVSKQVQVAQHLHRHFLRVTMDKSGQTIKVALSR